MDNLKWEFIALASGTGEDTKVEYITHIPARDIPAVLIRAEQLAAWRYPLALSDDEAELYRTAYFSRESPREAKPRVTQYRIMALISFDYHWLEGIAMRLMVNVISPPSDTPETAINDAVAHNQDLWIHGTPVPAGKGQLKLCKDRVLELYARFGDLLEDLPFGRPHSIYVPYMTKGGRGGWMTKIAQRRYSVDQLRVS